MFYIYNSYFYENFSTRSNDKSHFNAVMNITFLENLGEYASYSSNVGAVFSFLSNHGIVMDVHECRNRCKSKNLFLFELPDFYNFAERLNETNFVIHTQMEANATVKSKLRKLHDHLKLHRDNKYQFPL